MDEAQLQGRFGAALERMGMIAQGFIALWENEMRWYKEVGWFDLLEQDAIAYQEGLRTFMLVVVEADGWTS